MLWLPRVLACCATHRPVLVVRCVAVSFARLPSVVFVDGVLAWDQCGRFHRSWSLRRNDWELLVIGKQCSPIRSGWAVTLVVIRAELYSPIPSGLGRGLPVAIRAIPQQLTLLRNVTGRAVIDSMVILVSTGSQHVTLRRRNPGGSNNMNSAQPTVLSLEASLRT